MIVALLPDNSSAAYNRESLNQIEKCNMSFELATEELEFILDNLSPESYMDSAEIREKIEEEIERRKEIEELDFDDCLSCKI